MILNSGFPKNVQQFLEKLDLMSAICRLTGATLNRQGHYTNVKIQKMHDWLFYDGLKGKLQELTAEMFDEYTPSHLVFAQETL